MLFHRRTVSTTDCFGKACTSTIWDNSCAVSACAPWYVVLTLHCPKHFVHLAARDKDSIIPKSFKKTSNVAHRRTASQTLAPWISNDMPAQVRSKTTRPRAPKGKGRIREVHGCVLGYVDFRGIRSLLSISRRTTISTASRSTAFRITFGLPIWQGAEGYW